MRRVLARFTEWLRGLFGRNPPPVPEEDLQRYLDDGGAVVQDPFDDDEGDR